MLMIDEKLEWVEHTVILPSVAALGMLRRTHWVALMSLRSS